MPCSLHQRTGSPVSLKKTDEPIHLHTTLTATAVVIPVVTMSSRRSNRIISKVPTPIKAPRRKA